jgi:DNA-binding HxlR family transcriptional regulator
MVRFQSRLPVSLYVAGPFAMGYTEFYNFLIPLYGLSLGMSAGQIGMLVGARSLLAVFLSIHVLRDLVRFGPRKFQDLERSLSRISPNTLSLRLKRLEEAGIVERRFYEQHPPRAEYLLTEVGKELRPVLKALFEWGQRHTKYRAATT